MHLNTANFHCQSCNKRYDNQVTIPIILTTCDHTVCQACLYHIITNDHLCPYCKERLNNKKQQYKPNKAILNMLKEDNNNLTPANHQQPNDYWHKEKTKWYYISNNAKVTGWVQWNDSWFYFLPETGQMMTGWVCDNGKWYYLHSNGEMAEGWIKWDKEWYYLNPENGSMKTGWCEWDNQQYYLNPIDNGKMKLGWLEVDGKQYYLNPDNEGAMTKGHLIINNKRYNFNENGELISELNDDD